jgi:hypothetical protein
MADLLDIDRVRESGFLGVVTLDMDARLMIRNAVGRRWRMVAVVALSAIVSTVCSAPGQFMFGFRFTYLTCSLINSVTPLSSSHFPRNSSPRNGFSGFFSLPNCSLRLAYCCLSVLRNHFNTRRARFSGSASFAGATNSDGCSHQYELNSVRLVDERMKGGAVRDDRSPLNEAIDWPRCQDQLRFH